METPFRAALRSSAQSARPALAWPGRDVGFPEFTASVDACAAWLARSGCTTERIVGLSVADEFAHLVASMALLALGVPQALLPTHEPPGMRLDVARRLDIRRCIVLRPEDALPGMDALPLPPSALDPRAGAPVAQALPRHGPVRDFTFATSGTTGHPKLFGWDQATMIARSAIIAASERADARQRMLHTSAVEHRPAQARRLGSLVLGHTAVLQDPAQPLPVATLCERLGVTHVDAGLLQIRALVHDLHGAALPPATHVYTSGARVAASLRRAFRARFARPLFVHYGVSEFGRISSTFPDGEGDEDESLGRIDPSVEWRIVDDERRALPVGESGLLEVRTAHMMDGYVDDPVATARRFRDGWLMPGDVMRVDAAGRLQLVGRADEMINLHGIKVSPAEIERVLEAMPGVRVAVAFAQESVVHGQIPLAAVEVESAAGPGADVLLAAARAALGVRAPRRVLIVECLPRNAAGKVVTARLVELASRVAS